MLVIRLARKCFQSSGMPISRACWSFLSGGLASASTFAPSSNDLRRTAAILPAEPKEGQTVDVSICDTAHSPDGWIAVGSGVAAYEAER